MRIRTWTFRIGAFAICLAAGCSHTPKETRPNPSPQTVSMGFEPTEQNDPGPPPRSSWLRTFSETPPSLNPSLSKNLTWSLGPVFYRGRLTPNRAKVLILGFDDDIRTWILRRAFVGRKGVQVQEKIHRLGITKNYLFLNLFPFHAKEAEVLEQMNTPEFIGFQTQLIQTALKKNQNSLKLVVLADEIAKKAWARIQTPSTVTVILPPHSTDSDWESLPALKTITPDEVAPVPFSHLPEGDFEFSSPLHLLSLDTPDALVWSKPCEDEGPITYPWSKKFIKKQYIPPRKLWRLEAVTPSIFDEGPLEKAKELAPFRNHFLFRGNLKNPTAIVKADVPANPLEIAVGRAFLRPEAGIIEARLRRSGFKDKFLIVQSKTLNSNNAPESNDKVEEVLRALNITPKVRFSLRDLEKLEEPQESEAPDPINPAHLPYGWPLWISQIPLMAEEDLQPNLACVKVKNETWIAPPKNVFFDF